MSSLLAQASALTAQQAEISRELSTGSRLGVLSNDPIAAADSVRLSSRIANAGATLSVMQTMQSRLQATDSSLAAVVQQLTSAVSEAVSGPTDTPNAANRMAIAAQLSVIHDTVLGMANSSYAGAYLFAGTSNVAAPFSTIGSSGPVMYSGDEKASSFVLNGIALQTSLTGSAVFGSGAQSVFAVLQDAVTTLQGGSALSTSQVTALRSGLQTVIDQRSVLAANAARLNDLSSYTNAQQADLKAQQATIAASDPVALATQLSATQTQRTALLSSLAMLGKGSLFDYL